MAFRAIFSGYNAGVNHFNKSHKNTEIMKIHKNHLFDEISEINHKLLTSSERCTFSLYICGENSIQDTNILSTPAL